MGAIQSAINRGITEATIISTLSGPTAYQEKKQIQRQTKIAAEAERKGNKQVLQQAEQKIADIASQSIHRSTQKYAPYVVPEYSDQERMQMANDRVDQVRQLKQRQNSNKANYFKTSIGKIGPEHPLYNQISEVMKKYGE